MAIKKEAAMAKPFDTTGFPGQADGKGNAHVITDAFNPDSTPPVDVGDPSGTPPAELSVPSPGVREASRPEPATDVARSGSS